MAARTLKPWVVVFEESDWHRLHAHLFRDDDDEHGAVLTCGVVDDGDVRRLLVRNVVLAADGIDYVPGTSGYRALTADFIVREIDLCERERLAYLAVHNHFGKDAVAFSPTDIASHERGYPALLDITNGGPVGALVLAENAVAGDIWEADGRAPVRETLVLGANRVRLFPKPTHETAELDERNDRQVRLFGEAGQRILSRLRAGVVGLGGAGSIIAQALVHLGVLDFVFVDDDIITVSNLPRNVGARPSDVGLDKVRVAENLVSTVRSDVRALSYKRNIVDPEAARAIAVCDVIFLAADSMQARHVVNAICHQYLVPGFQVGAKVTSDSKGRVAGAFAVARALGPSGICMWCSELILADQLALEALPVAQQRAARYAGDIAAPSVITMNMVAASIALNDFLFSFTGLHEAPNLNPRRYHFLDREPVVEGAGPRSASCSECGLRKAFGDRIRLPVALT